MKGNELNPVFSAQLASDVYTIKDPLGIRAFKAEYKSKFEIDDQSFVTGKTGALIIVKKKHTMAVFAIGKGDYQGQAFVLIKGTASLYDALTDLNTGIRKTASGCSVHQGFLMAFESIQQELGKFLSTLKGVSVIHCVGHSLGGAIATLAADWIKTRGNGTNTKLYTFGGPRVGLEMFANKCTTRVLATNIYRVSHQTDPVPMLPTWPFYHVPTAAADYLLTSPVSAIPWEYHRMKHYIKSAEKAGSWDAMRDNRAKTYMDASIEQWLKSDGVISFTSNTLELMSAALCYVMKKIVNAAGILLVGGFATTFTLLDRMAVFLAKAAKTTLKVNIWVYRLVKKMAKLVGITVKEGTSLTVEFIRMVFLRLHQKISNLIWHAGQEVG